MKSAIRELAEKLKNSDLKTRQEMLDKLRKLREQAQNRKDIEQIENALKGNTPGAEKQPSSRPSSEKPETGTGQRGQRTESGKPTDKGPNAGTTMGQPKNGEGQKAEQPKGQEGQGKSPPQGQDGKGEKGEGKNKGPQSNGPGARRPANTEPSQPGGTPGMGSDGNRAAANNAGGSADQEGTAAN
jgi:hypothetical protein